MTLLASVLDIENHSCSDFYDLTSAIPATDDSARRRL